ncbi:MAG: PAS domain-containing protein [Deltaproteobacteria bacterium]|nr:PAS domain-containing protein [Deltaproteobacteria bacterium]
MKIIPFTLTKKVLLAFFAVLLPIIGVFIITYSNAKGHVKRFVLEDLRTIADEREGYVLLFMDINEKLVKDFANDGFIRSELQKILAGGKEGSGVLSRYLLKNKLPLAENFYHFGVISVDGVIRASTNASEIGTDASKEEYFINGEKGMYITEIEGPKPEIVISAPIYSRDGGRIIGVLDGCIYLSEFHKIFGGEYLSDLGAASSFSSSLKKRQTMEVYLVNRNRRMLTESRFIKDSVMKQRVDTPPVNACLESNKETTDFYRDYRGIEVAGASMCMPSLGWILVAEIDKDEALAPVNEIERYVVAAFIVTVVLTTALIGFFLRVFVRQINSLAGASREMASGNYEVNLPAGSGDEIGALTESFNSMAREISDRKRALEESRERLTNAQRIAHVGDWEWDIAKNVNRWSEEVFRIFGLESREGGLPYDEFLKRLHPDDREPVNRAVKDAITGNRPYSIDFRVIRPDGSERVVHSEAEVAFSEKGRAVRMSGTNQDITEIKNIEKTLRLSEASLANAQRIARIGNWDWDIARNTLHWSDEIYRIFGVAPQEFGATYDAFLGYVHPGDREFVEESVNAALRDGKPYSIDHRIALSDGAERVVHEQGEVAFDGNGNPVRMTGTVQDITERKMAEQEVMRLNAELESRVRERTAQLEASNRGLESFSYSVAHDLKSPLRTIDGFSKALIEDCSDRLDGKGLDYLKRVRDASQRMGRLIDDLLELSHITRTEMIYRYVDLSALARSIAAEFKKADPGREMEFIISDGLWVNGDAGLLKVALENLIGNACKFTGRLPSSRIEFSKMEKDGQTVFYVRDNGAGFDMDYAGKLFTPFQRLHSTTEFPGTGIGLATVARIIERHGGRVWGEGAVGRGATFYFTL